MEISEPTRTWINVLDIEEREIREEAIRSENRKIKTGLIGICASAATALAILGISLYYGDMSAPHPKIIDRIYEITREKKTLQGKRDSIMQSHQSNNIISLPREEADKAISGYRAEISDITDQMDALNTEIRTIVRSPEHEENSQNTLDFIYTLTPSFIGTGVVGAFSGLYGIVGTIGSRRKRDRQLSALKQK